MAVQFTSMHVSYMSASWISVAGTSGSRSFKTPVDVRPFEKSGLRKRSKKGRNKRQTDKLRHAYQRYIESRTW